MAKFLPLLLLLLLSALLRLSVGSSSPADSLFLSCGAATGTTVDDHRVFVPDSAFLPRQPSGSWVSVSAGPVENHPGLYRNARVFYRPSSYRFGIKRKGTFLVRLHFYPFASGPCDLSHARFHVLASGSVLLSDFHVGSGGKMAPFSRGCGVHLPRLEETSVSLVLKEYFLQVDSEELVVKFLPFDRSSFAFVNAIEVVPAPGLVPDIVLTVAPDGVEKSNGFSKQEFEVLFRTNTGGRKITPFNDTMWRNWVPDEEFLKPDLASETVHFSGRIQYQKYGASSEIAPYSVYDTARIMKLAKLPAPNSNMTWSFPVPHGYRYLMRLHFCDIASLALDELYFNIYVNGYNAFENFDLSTSTRWVLAAPYYLDFVAEPDNSGQLSVTIAPSSLSRPSKVNGLLNGLEIMKLNNSKGNLDDDVPRSSILSSQGTGGFGAFVRMFLYGSVFVALVVAASMLLVRWRNASRISYGWSPLPTFVPEGKLSFANHVPAGKSVEF